MINHEQFGVNQGNMFIVPETEKKQMTNILLDIHILLLNN
jgi:hypothetical protein